MFSHKTHKACPVCNDELLRYNPIAKETTLIFLNDEPDDSETFDASGLDLQDESVEFCNNAYCIYGK